MKFKEIQRSGVFAWSPLKTQASVVIASTQQQFDTNLSSDGSFEVHNLDIANTSLTTQLTCSKNIGSNTLNCICWHKQAIIGSSSNKLQAYDDKLNVLVQTPVLPSSITCLDSNNHSNTLASGNKDGVVELWDVSSSALNKTITLKPTGGVNDEVNTIRWNNQVQSILASSSNANVQVWDIRKSDSSGPIMRVHDSNAASIWGSGPQSLMISRALSWSNSQATTLVVANSNDANPILQVWDLRYATCPIKNMKGGHNRGIVSISWNSYDDDLLLTAGKDNLVCIWSPLTAQNEESLLAIVPNITNQWINEIEWCHWEPSLFAVSSFDGNTSIYDITQTNSIIQANEKILESFHIDSNLVSSPNLHSQQTESMPLLRQAPKWLRAPCRASWGFGGKLVCYENITSQTQSGQSLSQHVMTIKQVPCDPHFVKRVENLENTLVNDNLIDFCHYKISENSHDKQNEMVWKLVSIHMENDSKTKSENVLRLLGFDADQDISAKMNSLSTNSHSFNDTHTQFDEVYANINGTNNGKASLSPDTEHSHLVANLFEKKNTNIDISGESLVSRLNKSILSNNVSAAIDDCISENAWCEAFLFCFFIEPDSLNSTLKRYLSYCASTTPNRVSSLLWSIIALRTASGEQSMQILEQLISSTDLLCWKEMLAFLIRELSDDNEQDMKALLIEKLTSNLIVKYRETNDQNWLSAALFCCVLNGKYKHLVYFREIIEFMNLIEMQLVLQKACSGRMSQLEANALTSEYAYLLAREGKLDLAIKYINDNEEDLKHRIVGALNQLPKKQVASNQLNKVAPMARKMMHTQAYPNQAVNAYYNAASNGTQQYQQQPIHSQQQFQQMQHQTMPYPNCPTPSFQQNTYAPAPVATLMPNTVSHVAPPMQSNQLQQQVYGGAMQANEPPRPQATPGWNDPPPIDMNKMPSKPRHDSFTNRRTPLPVATIANQMPQSGPTYTSSVPPSYGAPANRPSYPPTPTSAVQYQSTFPAFAPSMSMSGSNLSANANFIPTMPMPSSTPPVGMMNPQAPPVAMMTPQAPPMQTEPPLRKPSSIISRRPSTPPIPLEALSPENRELFRVFDSLYERLLQSGASQSMNIKRKLDDVRIKLDTLKARLASNGLSAGTMQGLHAIASCINQGDFSTAMMHHQHLVASTTFGETVSFLPAIKVLLHLVQQQMHT